MRTAIYQTYSGHPPIKKFADFGESKIGQTSIDHFRRQGYLLLPGVLDEASVVTLKEASLREINEGDAPFRENTDGVRYRASRLFERNAVFQRAMSAPGILEALEGILGPNIELVLNRHNHATTNPPGYKAQRLHRDVLQWSRPIVTALIYLDDAPIAGSATHVIPGSQYLPYVGTPNNGGTWMDEHHVYAELLQQAVPVPAQAGDVLLADGLVFHAAGDNDTGLDRTVISCAYRSVDELISYVDQRECALVVGERLFRGDS